MRRPLIAGNWKMFKTVQESVAHIKELRNTVRDVRDVDIVVAPPLTSVYPAVDAARGSNIAVGAQDLYWEREGAFTGAVSAGMIAETGAEYVIVGHSERRTIFGESDREVNRKIAAAVGARLIPIVCVGETLEQHEAKQTPAVIDQQLTGALDGFTAEQFARMVVAYEPVWAIGTGKNATPAQAQDAHGQIRSRVRQWFGADAADACRVLYGGSVKPENVESLLAEADVDGALVGGASLDVKAFTEIVMHASARATRRRG